MSPVATTPKIQPKKRSAKSKQGPKKLQLKRQLLRDLGRSPAEKGIFLTGGTDVSNDCCCPTDRTITCQP